MKNLFRNILLALSLAIVSFAYAAAPTVDVTVADSKGKLVYKGKTGANGTFSTAKVEPGNYVVQFNANNLKGVYAIVASAGTKKVTANSVAGERFGKGGIALKVEVRTGVNISGQVAEAGSEMTSAAGAKVKVVNGKRYFWVSHTTGSNMGGHWVEEGSPEAVNVQSISTKSVSDLQDRGRGLREGE